MRFSLKVLITLSVSPLSWGLDQLLKIGHIPTPDVIEAGCFGFGMRNLRFGASRYASG